MRRLTDFSNWRRAASLAAAFVLFVVGLVTAPPALSANTCSAPGRDGPVFLAPTYFPGNLGVYSAGTSTVSVGSARLDANASLTAILPGDLALVMQMQDGSYSNSNSAAFGDGSTGRGMTSLASAGRYEFKTVAAIGLGTITFTQPLANTYTSGPATLSTGQKRFQVIRVPQFSNLTISGTVTGPAWDGTTGGVFVIDVSGTLTLNGTIDMSGQGFRGGGAYVNGWLLAASYSDYTAIYPLLPAVTPGVGGTKGEGIGGTPRFVQQPSSLVGAVLDLLVSGYPAGYDTGRGAPGNGGGGGDSHDGGGGGGANGGNGFSTDGGGKGGFSLLNYSSTNVLFACTPFTSGGTTYYGCNGDGGRDVGGLGGAAISSSIGRVFLGGGGGAGEVNYSGDTPSTGQNHGGNGGGIVFVRAGGLVGGGTLKADGLAGLNAGRDGAGGGGAGGTIVVHAPTGSYGVSASAKGGAGGTSGYYVTNDRVLTGPGGGGGGGLVMTASGVSIGSQAVGGGAAGVNTPLTTLSNTYGAQAGASGVANLSASIADPLGSQCLPNITITKTTVASTLQNTLLGGLIPYVITITNTGQGTADGISLLDSLPTGLTYLGGVVATLGGGATGNVGNAGTTQIPILGTFSLPASASVQLTLNATVAATLAGSVSNTGTAQYNDPLRTVATAKATVNSAAAVTVIASAPALTGNVYLDANHNGTMDGAESGTGLTGLFVKLGTAIGTTCSAPALFYTTVDPTTGAYSFGPVLGGTYCLIFANNNSLLDATPYRPPGYVGTEAPTSLRFVTVSGTSVPAQNFGLFAGSSYAGTVFTDNGSGGGTANDGLINGSEAGITGATVVAKSGASTIATTTTDASGNYALWLPASTSGAIGVVETPLAAAIAISGVAGTTGGTYARATNTTTLTFANGNAYTGVNFGNVPANTLSTTGVQSAGPNSTVPYPHTFVAGSAGNVTFTTSAASTPSASWTQTIVQDANCNGIADAGEPVVTGAVAVTAGQTVCVIVKDTMPGSAANGAQDVVTVSATMTYANATPTFTQAVVRTDTTTVSTSTLMQLAKQVRNVTTSTGFATANNASPNDVLEYQVVATNPASASVSSVVVGDVTPTYTTFVSAACPGALPSGIAGCAVTTQPAVGATGTMTWTFTGTLPAAGSVTVTYQVRVNQ